MPRRTRLRPGAPYPPMPVRASAWSRYRFTKPRGLHRFYARLLDRSDRRPPIYCGMEQTLLLNATYEPLKVVDWRKAVTLWCQGKVEVISVHDREVRSVSVSFKLPSVIRLLRYIRIKNAGSTTCHSPGPTSMPGTATAAGTAVTRPLRATSPSTTSYRLPTVAEKTGRTLSRAVCRATGAREAARLTRRG